MPHIRFEEPVTVMVGMGLPVRIETVMEAYALLQDWPPASRNGAHAVALNACKAGLAGEIDAETVRATFVAFARRHDILVPDAASLPLSNAARPILPANSGMFSGQYRRTGSATRAVRPDGAIPVQG